MQSKLIVYRKNGDAVDVTAYCSNVEVDNGSATNLGESGVDGVASTLSFTLNNAKEVNYCPLVEYGANISEEVSITGTGATTYSCAEGILEKTLFTNNEEITVKLSGNNFVFNRPILTSEVIKVKYTRYDLTVANPINRVSTSYNPLIDDGAKVEFFVNDEEWKSGSQTITGNGSKRYSITNGNAIDKTCFCLSDAEIACTLDTATNEVVFSRNIESIETVTISYSYYENEPVLLFSGYISADISIDGEVDTLQVFCSDKAWRLQKKYIDNLETNVIRTYAVETLLAETLMQNILDDLFGIGEIALYVPVSTGQQIEIVSNEWAGKTAWDCLQSIASSIGWFLGYEYNNTTSDFELYLRSVPRSKNTVDFTLDYQDDILPNSPLVINGSTMYNVLYLYYTDKASGKVLYVKSENTASVNNYGDRVGIITEASTAGINNATQAQQLANDIISDISTKIITLNVEIPFKMSYNDNRIKFFDTFAINYPKMSSLIEFFSIEGMKHTFDFAGNSFKTVFTGNMQKVRGGSLKWTSKVRRPEGYRQITSREIGAVNLLSKPSSLTVIDSGIDKLDLASSAYAVLQWNRPLGEYPKRYELQVRKSSEDYQQAIKYSIIPEVIAGSEQVRQRVPIQTGINYKFRVYAIDTSGIKGDVSDEGTINQVGDTVPPAVVSSLSVSAGVKQMIVSFNPNTTDADFLKYRIYYNKGSEPTTATTTYKETASTKTTIDNLDTDDNYYVRVTAIDTSGNESALSTAGNFAKPYLVNDDIFAEIRDKTLHIKTNAQMQQWVDSLNDVTSTTPTYTDISSLYNTVKLYNINYTLTRGIALLCADEFNIEGVGSSAITFNNLNASNAIRIRAKKLNWKNLNLKKTAGLSAQVVLNAYSDLDLFLVNIENSSFSNVSGLSFNFSCNNANFGTTNLNIKSIEMENFNFTAYVLNSSEFINSNLSVITSKIKTNANFIVLGTWNSINIADNQFILGGLALDSLTTTNSGKIINNFFRKNFAYSATPQYFLDFGKSNLKQMFICQNSFSAYRFGATLTLRDVYIARLNGTDVGNPAEFKYSQFCNNVIFSEEISTITPIANIYLEGVNTDVIGTIIANNTNN